jgi:hypothetical protein
MASSKIWYQHLQLPAVYDEIKNLPPAKSQQDILKSAERIVSKIEALSSLKEDTQPLPSDVTTSIFRALHLSTEEKKEVLPLLERPEEVSIAEMRKYTAERFKMYELMARTINKHWQPKTKNYQNTNEVHGGAGLTESEDGQGHEEYPEQEGQRQVSLENNPKDGDSKPKFPLRTRSCLYCTAKQNPALYQAHWTTNCPYVTALVRPEITQMLPDVCLGCLRKRRRNQVHKCPDFLKKSSRSSDPQFCVSCNCHRKMCISPNLLQAVTLPEIFE